MILFKPEMARAILKGRKTVTRRPCVKGWTRPRVKVGNEYQARTRMLGEPFARLLVTDCFLETRPLETQRRLVECTRHPGSTVSLDTALRRLEIECEREGFGCYKEFAAVWVTMHGETALNEPCWRISFSVVRGSERPEAIA